MAKVHLGKKTPLKYFIKNNYSYKHSKKNADNNRKQLMD